MKKEIAEAALFAAGSPLDAKKLGRILDTNAKNARAIVEELINDYKMRNTGLEIVRVEDRYVMQVKPVYSEQVRPVAPKELSAPVLRTLAMIAYHQPILQSDLVKKRGNTTYDHVKLLLDRGLIDSEPEGRTRRLWTTEEFADYFGLTTSDPEEIKSVIASMARQDGMSLDQWMDIPTTKSRKNMRELLRLASQARIILR